MKKDIDTTFSSPTSSTINKLVSKLDEIQNKLKTLLPSPLVIKGDIDPP